jgi:hypothetical protein
MTGRRVNLRKAWRRRARWKTPQLNLTKRNCKQKLPRGRSTRPRPEQNQDHEDSAFVQLLAQDRRFERQCRDGIAQLRVFRLECVEKARTVGWHT